MFAQRSLLPALLSSLLCLPLWGQDDASGAPDARARAQARFEAAAHPDSADPGAAPRIPADEVWAYLQEGEESFIKNSLPVTDLAYFCGSINSSGQLAGLPDPKALGNWKGRRHLVVAEIGNSALTHFCLDPALPLRAKLLDDLAAAAGPYDGLQLDFEAVLTKDADNFITFLAELKRRIGPKVLSAAIPARYKDVGDAYDYRRLGAVVDRLIIMAYDEHWSGSAPGPVASQAWGSKVAAYALSVLGPGKTVMGLPFYGRAWADKSLSRAYRHSGISRLLSEKGEAKKDRVNGVPTLEYSETVNVRVFYEDAQSTAAKLDAYRAAGVARFAFWRLGQEDPAAWSLFMKAPPAAPSPTPAPETAPAASPLVQPNPASGSSAVSGLAAPTDGTAVPVPAAAASPSALP